MIRLQKVLADRGVASRRHAEDLITGGRVRVDGAIVRTLGTKVAPDARIEVDGARTQAAVARYIAFNKPAGLVSTARDERGRRTVVDAVGARERLYPVGRLDAESEGLVLLTNDGEWAERVLHPRYGHEREYEVTVSGDLSSEAITQLRRGIRLEEGLARAERVEVLSRSHSASRLRIVLRTGWKRQIRRMCAAVGLRVERLVRIRIGTLGLGRLRIGDWRELTPTEIRDIARPVERTSATPSAGRRAAAAAPRAPGGRGPQARSVRGGTPARVQARGKPRVKRVSAQRPTRARQRRQPSPAR